jgi:hypothetical protein
MVKYLREELILSRSLNDHQAKRIVNYLCPTSVGHHLGKIKKRFFLNFIRTFGFDILGLDVHDCELVSFSTQLQPGNVITIEPGK